MRRDGEDVVLESAKCAEADAQELLTAARLISEMLRSEETAGPVLKVLPAAFPWMRFLPDEAAGTGHPEKDRLATRARRDVMPDGRQRMPSAPEMRRQRPSGGDPLESRCLRAEARGFEPRMGGKPKPH